MITKFEQRNLPMLLLQARESVMRYFRPQLKKYGLTEQQWRVIRALDEFGEMEAGKLAEVCSILGPSLSGVLNRMERDQWIVRFRVSTDQRKVYIEITEKSREIVALMQKPINEQYQALEKMVGQESMNSLYALLNRLTALPYPAESQAPVVRTRISSRHSHSLPAEGEK
jgi:homoprotocatechuate degradation regulator HpaR